MPIYSGDVFGKFVDRTQQLPGDMIRIIASSSIMSGAKTNKGG
jgi:hypothetical protein